MSRSNVIRAAVSFAVESLEARQLMSSSISGTVFIDSNANHARDNGEAILAGQQVYLDLQGVDQLVAGDPTATTDATGHYTFTNLAAGNYLVRPVPQAGKVITSPVWGGKYFVQLGTNQNITGDDFGMQTGVTSLNVAGMTLVAGTTNGAATLTSYVSDGSTNVNFGSLGTVTLPASVTGQPATAALAGANIVVTYATQVVTLTTAGAIVSVTPTGGPVTPPTITTPTALSLNATSATSVFISFTDNATNEQNYIVERSASVSGPWSTVLTIAGTTTTGTLTGTDTTAVASTTYFYRVTGVSGSTLSSVLGPVSVTTPAATVTPPTSGATITGTVYNDANADRIRNSGETAVAGQKLYLDLQGLGSFVAGDPTATTDANGVYTFTGLAAGNYLVRPIATTGEVITSPVWGGKYFLQLAKNQTLIGNDFGVQTGGTSFALGSQLLVAGTANGLPTLARYNADASTDVNFGSLGTVTLPNTVSGVPTSAVLQGSNVVVTYPGQIVTLSTTGAVISVTNTVTPPVTIVTPTALGLVATSQTLVTITFTDNATNEASYTVERSSSATGPWTAVATIAGTTGTGTRTATDSTAVANTTYFYRVYGVLGAVQSTVAGPVSVTTPSQPVTTIVAPTGLGLVANSSTSVAISFTDNAANEASYTIERSSSATGPWTTVGTIAGTTSTGLESATDNTAVASTTYFYRVYGINGAVQSAIAGPLTVTTPSQPVITIAAPTGLGLVANSSTSVTIAFTDNATNEATYTVERSSSAAGPWTTVSTVAGTTGTGVRTVIDTTAVANTTYFYRVYGVLGAVQSPDAGPLGVTTPPAVIVISKSTITGTVFDDTNGNGIRDNGEAALTGRQVYLDLQGLGVFANGDPIVSTDANGMYTLTGLNAGNYLVRLLPVAGRAISAPLFGGKFFVQLGTNQTINGDDFGTVAVGSVNVTNSSGQIIVAGVRSGPGTQPTTLSRFNADGSIDIPFGTYGVVTLAGVTGQPTAISLLPTGEMVLTFSNGTVTLTSAGVVESSTITVTPPTGPTVPVPAAGSAWAPFAQMIGQDVAANQYPTVDGTGVGVVVIDRGIDYNVPQIGAAKIAYQYNFRDNNGIGLDDYGHGTGVAGIIAANGYNYVGTYNQGVAPGAHLIDLKQESSAGIKLALDWVIANHVAYNIQVVNITDFITDVLPGSWNPTQYLPELQTIYNLGIFITSPVGNGEATYGPNLPIDNPAASPYVTGVGGVDLTGGFYADSKRGTGLEILAPANNVTMPYYVRNVNSTGADRYDDNYDGTGVLTSYASGTSWASAYVAGTAALLKQIGPSLTPAQIQSILQQSGTPVLDPTNNVYYQRINVNAAIQLAYQTLGIKV